MKPDERNVMNCELRFFISTNLHFKLMDPLIRMYVFEALKDDVSMRIRS